MTGSTSYRKTKYMVLCGLFAALTAVCAWIIIPLGFTPVPVNLGTMAVFLAGGILGKKYGTISIAVYVLLGAAGLPVYSGFTGGLGILAGLTGGYLAGYIAAAFLTGWLIEQAYRKGTLVTSRGASSGRSLRGHVICAAAMTVGLSACYGLGTLWFMVITGSGVWAALAACVFPFLPADALKIAAAAVLTQKLRPILCIMEVL